MKVVKIKKVFFAAVPRFKENQKHLGAKKIKYFDRNVKTFFWSSISFLIQ